MERYAEGSGRTILCFWRKVESGRWREMDFVFEVLRVMCRCGVALLCSFSLSQTHTESHLASTVCMCVHVCWVADRQL